MTRILTYDQIDRQQWSELVRTSETGTWFQSPEAYDFFASLPALMEPFVYGVGNDEKLYAVCVGYVTKERNPIKQFFTRRAIITGGPCLADDCSNQEVSALMSAVKNFFGSEALFCKSCNDEFFIEEDSAIMNNRIGAQRAEGTANSFVSPSGPLGFQSVSRKKRYSSSFLVNPIFIECRNFNDYSRWKSAFIAAGFAYQPHLNFHVDCTDKVQMDSRLSDTRAKQVRRARRAGVEIMEVRQEGEIREWYAILREMYRTKVKTPLWPVAFFIRAHECGAARFLMVKEDERIIGGLMMVEDEKCVYEWFECGRDTEYERLYPSVMATYAGMEYAAAHGIARCDFMGAGEPGVPYGVRDFKARFGGELVEHGRFLYVCKPMLYSIGKLGVKFLKRK